MVLRRMMGVVVAGGVVADDDNDDDDRRRFAETRYRHPSATARLMRWSCVNSKLRLASELSATGLEAEPTSASPADPLAYSFFRLVSVDPLEAAATDPALQ